MMKSRISPRVVAVADLLKRFSRHELSQLVTLVPTLNNVQPDNAEDVIAHFRQLGQEQRVGRTVDLTDPFIGGLTYAQYFALSEAEQDAFWEQLFLENYIDMETIAEMDVTPDADLSAR